ncbi:MAG: SRPBCC domain-containing protein [Hyphomicrobiaceae bacterium]
MIEKSVWLAVPPDEAFRLFTEKAGSWWPEDRRHTGDPESEISIDVATGRFAERARDGREVVLGRVREAAPPGRLILDFYVATGPAYPTEVEVTFSAEKGGTRLMVRHRPRPESAHLWKERAPRYALSWDRVLAAVKSAIG